MDRSISSLRNIIEKYINEIPFLCPNNSFDSHKTLLENKWDCIHEEIDGLAHDDEALRLLSLIEGKPGSLYRAQFTIPRAFYQFINRYPMVTWLLTIAEEYPQGYSLVVFVGRKLPSSLLILLDNLPEDPKIIYFIRDMKTARYLRKKYPYLEPTLKDPLEWAKRGLLDHFLWALADPSFTVEPKEGSEYIYHAARLGLADLVKILMDRIPYNPRSVSSNALGEAIYKSRYDVVKAILENPEIDPSINNNDALITSLGTEVDIRIFESLIKDPRIDINLNNSIVLYEAVKSGHDYAVERILNHPRLNLVSRDHYYILMKAVEKNEISIVEMFLKDGRIRPDNSMLEYAINRGYMDLASLLAYYFSTLP